MFKRKKYLISAAVVTVLLFFGVSVSMSLYKGGRLGQKKEISVKIDLKGLKPVMAATADDWQAVRDIASFIRNVVKGIDQIIVDISSSGALGLTQAVTQTSGEYRWKFDPNNSTSFTSKSFGSLITPQYSFEIWKVGTGDKVLEIFFDNPQTKQEVIVVWHPVKFDASLETASGKIECGVTGGIDDGTMICSWSEGPFETGGVVTQGRMRVKKDQAGGVYKVKTIAKTSTFDPDGAGIFCSSNIYYYSLFFITKDAAPFYTTAKFGLDTTNVVDTICGQTNTFNAAYFNTNTNASSTGESKFFVQDGVTAGTQDPNYPTITEVDSLISDTTNSMTTGKVDSYTGGGIIDFYGSLTMP